MAKDSPVASRYAQALFDAAKTDGVVDETVDTLRTIERLVCDHAELHAFLLNPGVEPDDKVGVVGRLLKGSWSGLVRAFVQMVVSAGRAEYLPDIAVALQAIVDQDQGRLRVTVRSTHPLSEAALARLRTRLARREGKQIELTTELDPALLGGVQVLLDHRVIDGSVRRQLQDLRQRLTSIRVH